MEHAHEEQYFRKLVGLIVKIIFNLKVFFLQHHIKERINISMSLVSAINLQVYNVHVYLVT